MSITSRISSMEEHVTNAYNGLQGLGADLTNVDKNIDNIASVLDDIYDSMPQVSGEGTSLTLDDTRVGKIKSTLKGNTSQTGTPTPSSPIPINVVSGDNEINVCGKNLINGLLDDSTNGKPLARTINSGEDFYLYLEATTTSDRVYAFLDNTNVGTIYLSVSQGVCTFSGNKNFSFNRIRIPTGMVLTKNMLKLGSTASTYEPYQGNTYNIDLPVKNLVNTLETNTGITGSGLTYNRSEDGSIEIKGTTNRAWDYTLTTNCTFEAGKTYTFSVDGIDGEVFYVLLNSANGGQLSVNQYNSSKTVTINETQTLPVKWSKASGLSVDLNLKIMIEEGTKANAYTLYGTTPIELCKIGNYQDYFYKDSDKWYLHKEIGKVVLNGSESGWNYQNGCFTLYDIPNIIKTSAYGDRNQILVMSDYFKAGLSDYRSGISATNYQIAKAIDSNGTQIAITFNDYTSISDFTIWLSSHNVVVYYVLATPVNTALEDM